MNPLEKIIKDYCKEHKIKIVKKFGRATGRCYVDERIIHIPKDFSKEENLIVALHEIAHIIKYANCKKPLYIEEYRCDRWALKEAKPYISDKTYYNYSQRSMTYIIYHICVEIEKKGLEIEQIPQEIVNYVKDHILWYQVTSTMKK